MIKKITTGFVVQVFDDGTGQYVSQEFVAGEVDYEPADGDELMPEPEPYLPFEMVQPRRLIKSKHVRTIELTDPDTGLPVELEIRKMESGAIVGFDGSYLATGCGSIGDHPQSPYDGCGTKVEVPDDEIWTAQKI